jgi:phosphomannomutase/phosphoglucomutase
VQLFGTPAQHIVMVERVANAAGAVVGVAHLSLSVDFLSKAVSALKPAGAYIEVRQPQPKLLVLDRGGVGVPSTGTEPIVAPIPGSRWTIAYWPTRVGAAPVDNTAMRQAPAATVQHAANRVPIILGLGVVAVVAVAVVFVLLKQRGKGGGQTGEVVFQGAVVAIMEGVHPGLERLVPGLPKLAKTAKATATVMPMSQGLDGADITMIGKPPSEPGMPLQRSLRDEVPEVEELEDITEPDSDTEPVTEEPFAEAAKSAKVAGPAAPPASIFRAYDIRGIVGETLTRDDVYRIGLAIGSEATDRGQQGIVVARDGRASSEELSDALIKGLRESGRDVIDIGLAPTPVLYYATHYLDTLSGVMITGSHNPPRYNGLKIVLGGEALSGDAIMGLRKRIEAGTFSSGQGDLQSAEIIPEYIQRISEDIPVSLGNAFKVVVDCGNGVPGIVAPRLIRALGHDVLELYCDVDSDFPNHHPDPSQPENLQDLMAMVKAEGADLGLAFDGDGDRLGVVDGDGNIIWPDRQMMLFARDVLSRNPGAEIIYDVKCSGHLKQVIEEAGGRPLMWRTGHSLVKAKMRETGSPLAGEMSGHIFFKERWYGFDDAMYAAARLLEILVGEGRPPRLVFAELPGGVATPELRIDLPEARHAEVMQALVAAANFPGGEIATVDGLRVDFEHGWGLIRASNTTPMLVLRFEADDEASLADVQAQFRTLIQTVDPSLTIPF